MVQLFFLSKQFRMTSKSLKPNNTSAAVNPYQQEITLYMTFPTTFVFSL